MDEQKEITHKSIGYSFSITVEYEERKPKEGSKYDDKIITKYTINGNVDTFNDAIKQLSNARAEIKKIHNDKQ